MIVLYWIGLCLAFGFGAWWGSASAMNKIADRDMEAPDDTSRG